MENKYNPKIIYQRIMKAIEDYRNEPHKREIRAELKELRDYRHSIMRGLKDCKVEPQLEPWSSENEYNRIYAKRKTKEQEKKYLWGEIEKFIENEFSRETILRTEFADDRVLAGQQRNRFCYEPGKRRLHLEKIKYLIRTMAKKEVPIYGLHRSEIFLLGGDKKRGLDALLEEVESGEIINGKWINDKYSEYNFERLDMAKRYALKQNRLQDYQHALEKLVKKAPRIMAAKFNLEGINPEFVFETYKQILDEKFKESERKGDLDPDNFLWHPGDSEQIEVLIRLAKKLGREKEIEKQIEKLKEEVKSCGKCWRKGEDREFVEFGIAVERRMLNVLNGVKVEKPVATSRGIEAPGYWSPI